MVIHIKKERMIPRIINRFLIVNIQTNITVIKVIKLKFQQRVNIIKMSLATSTTTITEPYNFQYFRFSTFIVYLVNKMIYKYLIVIQSARQSGTNRRQEVAVKQYL